MKTYHGKNSKAGCLLSVSFTNGGWHRLNDTPIATAHEVALTILGHCFGSTQALAMADEFATEVIGSSLTAPEFSIDSATIESWVIERRMALSA